MRTASSTSGAGLTIRPNASSSTKKTNTCIASSATSRSQPRPQPSTSRLVVLWLCRPVRAVVAHLQAHPPTSQNEKHPRTGTGRRRLTGCSISSRCPVFATRTLLEEAPQPLQAIVSVVSTSGWNGWQECLCIGQPRSQRCLADTELEVRSCSIWTTR